MKAIHQIVAGFRRHDAISNEALCLQAMFRGWGLESEIGSDPQRIETRLMDSVRDADQLAEEIQADDIVLLHLSTGSSLNAWFAALPCRKIIRYHNVTPPDYFRQLDMTLADELEEGRRQVAALAGVAELTLAVSQFNADDLHAMGYEHVSVFPLVIDFSQSDHPVDESMRQRFGDGVLNLLFVGRCVPNKRIESLLRVLHVLQISDSRRFRLLHVGSYDGARVYHSILLAQVRELALQDVHFLGPLNQAQLNACYAASDVFLCMSEHEGFCVPLIEALAYDLPIVALKRAAVPETLGVSGIQFDQPDFALIAEAIRQLADNADLRQGVIAAQRQRLRTFRERDASAELRTLIAPLMVSGAANA